MGHTPNSRLADFAIAIAQQLRTMPAVQEFILRYPGDTSSRTVNSGFPLWLRLLHFFNLFFMMFIIRAGIQILADHPRLYLAANSTPGTEWFRFRHEVPEDPNWTSKDEFSIDPKMAGHPRHSPLGGAGPLVALFFRSLMAD